MGQEKMQNYRLTLCYDGSRYRGWQRQGNTDNTIQAKLETALSRLLEQPVEVHGAGRTDAGVHARRQTASFKARTALSPQQLLGELRRCLPEDIGALALEPAAERFHARLSCRGKTYVYRIWNSEEPCVFERKYVTVFPGALDVQAMEAAAEILRGRHDFAAFSTGHTKKSTVRTVEEIRIEPLAREIRLTFSGDGFLYNMVRILTGTLLEVGRGAMSPARVETALEQRERGLAGPTAPAAGLILWDERY